MVALVTGACAVAALSPASAAAMSLRGPFGQFASPCQFTHRLPDDPIVHPGFPGVSHSHDFFGNTSTNADSTFASLRGSVTACDRIEDTAAYWVPTLFDGQVSVRPAGAQIYYQTRNRDPGTIVSFPPGLKAVGGDAAALEPQDESVTTWGCEFFPKLSRAGEVPTCPPGNNLVMTVNFPDCWDGRKLDSIDHRSHMAYSGPRFDGVTACPDTHPVAVPGLVVNIKYPTPGGPDVTLASGPATTAHADFFNAWDPDGLDELVRRCLRAGLICIDR